MPLPDSPDEEVIINRDRKPRPSFQGISVLPSPLTRMFDAGTPQATKPQSRGDLTALASRLRRVHIDPPGTRAEGGPARTLAFDDADDDVAQDKENVPRNPFLYPNANSKLDRPSPLADRPPNVITPAETPPPAQKAPLPASFRTPDAERNPSPVPYPAHTPDAQNANSPAPAPAPQMESLADGAPAARSPDAQKDGSPAPVPALQMERVADEASTAPVTFSARGEPMDFTPAVRQTPATGPPPSAPVPSPMNISETPAAQSAATGSLVVVLQSPSANSWQQRCAALESLSAALEEAPTSPTSRTVAGCIDKLTDALISHLGESRPSIIRGALGLIESLVETDTAKGSALPERVFDEVLDLVCGQSLTAENAAVTLAVLLANNRSLNGKLKNADNPDRLFGLLKPTADLERFSQGQKQALADAVSSVSEILSGGQPAETTPVVANNSPKVTEQDGGSTPAPVTISSLQHPSLISPETGGDGATHSAGSEENEQSPSSSLSKGTPRTASAKKASIAIAEAANLAMNAVTNQEESGIDSSLPTEMKRASDVPAVVEKPVQQVASDSSSSTPAIKMDESVDSCTARPDDAEAKSMSSDDETVNKEESDESASSTSNEPKTPRAPKPPLPSGASATASVPRNKRLCSARRLSPTALRKVKRFTTEDLEEAKREAVEDALQAAEAKASMEREDLERRLSAEKKDKEELHIVLGKFEKTMTTMAADKRSSVSAPMHALLDVEVNRLKTELFETTNAFNALKERYAEAKEAVAVISSKESRVVEQNHELRQSLIELQKWSNDLKANTEKKLAKSFEAVSEYRSAALDREAHADKAMSELKLANRDLDAQKVALSEASKKLAAVETNMHESQDLCASLQAALDVSKTTVAELTGERNSAREEADASRLALARMQDEFDRLKESESKASEAVIKVASLEVENRSLKANAYDQMTKGRALEKKLAEKEKECEELNSIAEELLSNMEKAS